MSKENGGPAFPFGQTDELSGQLVNGWGSEGMTLRDYFAGQALPAIFGNDGLLQRLADAGIPPVKHAYTIADAMLAERNEERAQ